MISPLVFIPGLCWISLYLTGNLNHFKKCTLKIVKNFSTFWFNFTHMAKFCLVIESPANISRHYLKSLE